MNMTTLSQLRPGQRAVVLENHCTRELRHRLEDLGLTPGLELLCLHTAPSGSPAAYEVRGALIALRRSDAESILVGVP